MVCIFRLAFHCLLCYICNSLPWWSHPLHSFKCHLFEKGSQIYTSSLNSELTSYAHLDVHKHFKWSFLPQSAAPANSLPPLCTWKLIFLITQANNLGVTLDSSHTPSPINQKSCLSYLQNSCRIWALLASDNAIKPVKQALFLTLIIRSL